MKPEAPVCAVDLLPVGVPTIVAKPLSLNKVAVIEAALADGQGVKTVKRLVVQD